MHDGDFWGIEDRVHIMVDISDDTPIVRRHAEVMFLDHRLDALGKAFRIKIQRIVVAVGNVGIERGVIGRNEPVLRAHAGDNVEKRKPVVLRGRESRIGALRIVVATVAERAPRLNQLDMQEEAFQRA